MQDNAGNWSAWADHTDHGRRSASTRPRPTDTTVDPVAVAARRRQDPRHRRRRHRRHRRRLRPVALRQPTDRPGPERQRVHDHRRRRARDRDARGRQAPATRPRGAARRCGSTPPSRPTRPRSPTRLDELATPSPLQATDATSGIASIEYKIDNAAPVQVAATAPRSRSRPTATTASATARSTTRARPRAGRTTSSASTRSTRPTRRAAAPTTWQTSALSLALTGTDARVRRRPRRVARGRRRRPDRHARRWSTTEGIADARDADRRQGRQRLDLALGDASGSTDQAGQHDRPPSPRPGARRTSRRRSPAPTRPPARACRGSSTSSTTAPSRPPRPSRSPPRARTSSRRAWSTSPATSPTGAIDTIGIDKTNPDADRDCGGDAWRAAPAVCSVAADGGVSGLATLTAARGPARPTPSPAAATPSTPTAPRP